MRTNGYQTYLENEVLSASPLRLIQILYRAALDSISSARRFVRAGEIRARSRAITKAMRIVTELSQCLDREAGGDLSENLANVYGYVLKLLMESNANQSEAPLAEAENLLSTLAEAWSSCATTPSEPAGQEAGNQLLGDMGVDNRASYSFS
jgi:flagellar secretion chaperone FliS